MRITCVYTVERGASGDKPLPFAMDIPFGISIIATVLKQSGHEVDLLVFSEGCDFWKKLRRHLSTRRPGLVCLTAVSTQFFFISRIAHCIKQLDPSVFVLLGGHHASLDSEEAIKTETLDAICVGEGDVSVVELATQLADGLLPSSISNLWIKRPDGSVEKNPTAPFREDLDSLPYIDRTMWEPWINEPSRFPSILLGRGCPFKCTYCSNHAMQELASGVFTRFRSPDNVVGEVEALLSTYPNIDSIYLEVETVAHQKEAYPLFERLAQFNANRSRKITFGLNFTVTSSFIRQEQRCQEFLQILNKANVGYLNIGLESGSEKLRRDVLRRPRYTNEEFVRFAKMAQDCGINLDYYVLIGVPGETLDDYWETVRVVRATQPKMVFLSIFFPYLGTDLCNVAIEQGLITKGDLDPIAERARPALNLPGFSRFRVRVEYVLFWFRVYRGHWPMAKILVSMVKGFVNGSPNLWSLYQWLQSTSVWRSSRSIYRGFVGRHEEKGHIHRPAQIEFTYRD